MLTQSALLTAHLIGLRGVPILGRSVIYRTAVPVPLLAESIADPSAATCGRARRALHAVWRYFIAHGCLRNGTLAQRYFDSDPRLSSATWVPEAAIGGFDQLVLAYTHAPGSEFWTSADEPLPVEVADYRLEFKKLGWVIEGRKADSWDPYPPKSPRRHPAGRLFHRSASG